MLLDFGLLLIRFVIGLVVAAHGAQKMFGWFSGPGIPGTQKMMRSLNVHPSGFWALVSAGDELIGGLLVLFGFLMPLGPAMIIANMLVAILFVHIGKGFWNSKGGIEYPLVLGSIAFVLAITGAGAYSVDAMLGTALPEPTAWIVLTVLIILGLIATYASGRLLPSRTHAEA